MLQSFLHALVTVIPKSYVLFLFIFALLQRPSVILAPADIKADHAQSNIKDKRSILLLTELRYIYIKLKGGAYL